MVFDRRGAGILYAVRFCYGGDWLYQSEKRRQHHYEKVMDFCIGTVVFMLLGYCLMMGEHTFFGLIGKPDLALFTNFEGFDWSAFVFQLVFCATAATIVSGAMAERTKFSAYCI